MSVTTTLLSPEQIAAFRSEGFVALPCLAMPKEVTRMRAIFERLFHEEAGRKMGAHYDLAGTDDGTRPARLPQILNPAKFAPELLGMRYRTDVLSIARQLLGEETIPWFEHAILKPPGYGAATPWHQDEAHRNDAGTYYEQLSVWMPLQPATEDNGCMRFLPGTHRGGVLTHRSPRSDPRIMALECIGSFDPVQAAVCPLPAGGATIHHCRTLHAAGANTSEVPRYAYILAFRGPMRPEPAFTGYAWNAEKQTAAQARRHAWENRGGALGRASRQMAGSLAALGRKVGERLRPRR